MELKDKPILIVDPDTVFAFEITFKRLKPIRGRRFQILQCMCCIQKIKLPLRNSPDMMRDTSCGSRLFTDLTPLTVPTRVGVFPVPFQRIHWA